MKDLDNSLIHLFDEAVQILSESCCLIMRSIRLCYEVLLGSERLDLEDDLISSNCLFASLMCLVRTCSSIKWAFQDNDGYLAGILSY